MLGHQLDPQDFVELLRHPRERRKALAGVVTDRHNEVNLPAHELVHRPGPVNRDVDTSLFIMAAASVRPSRAQTDSPQTIL